MVSAQASTRIYAGTSGWAYPTWKPEFYPPKTPTKKFLEFYASQLTSVEVNYTFRALPTEKILEGWLASTPSHFRFSFKAPQRITHFRRLRDCDADVVQFLAALEPVRQVGKLGLLLFQLPPNFKADAGLLTTFLSTPTLQAARNAPRIAFEFRHESWFSEEIYRVLRQHEAALCIAESDDLITPEVHTAAAFTCFRLRRSGAYSSAELDSFAKRFTALAEQRDVYAYFKHEDEPTGALNAKAFLDRTMALEDKH
ncbi:DUF72 domain-containing protein [Edaphobacter dinghuensis]|uniref:DUF72 domain-containing protein n=1 Tax=Edaphobacter dinghuensis TaxID=1560005 RepID=A0A917MAG0_9BACT|nr:DUF72 domain-containing protein [Edaphobacter dinghuensis]GGG89277.1 hypothetical protein GCM10011585_36840 [Edaphobacter dinghuensis]